MREDEQELQSDRQSQPGRQSQQSRQSQRGQQARRSQRSQQDQPQQHGQQSQCGQQSHCDQQLQPDQAPFAFRALGTAWEIVVFAPDVASLTAQPLSAEQQQALLQLIEEFDATLSRFRTDSLVGRIKRATTPHLPEDNSEVEWLKAEFPGWVEPLFALYDALYVATGGSIDPTVGASLEVLGYDRDFVTIDADSRSGLPATASTIFAADTGAADTASKDAVSSHISAPTWRNIRREGSTLFTPRRGVALDFGAVGKGFLVDLLAQKLEQWGYDYYLVDASGDFRVSLPPGARPLRIALQDPANLEQAIGIAEIHRGAFCASAISRRRWQDARSNLTYHHILDALTGEPTRTVAATWVSIGSTTAPLCGAAAMTPFDAETTAFFATETVTAATSASTPIVTEVSATGTESAKAASTPFVTALCDGLATTLFSTPPQELIPHFDFQFALIDSERHPTWSRGFPGSLFLAAPENPPETSFDPPNMASRNLEL